MRPEGPVPLIFAKGIPRSKAIFFAMGEAKILSPVGRDSLASTGAASGVGLGLDGSGAFSSALGLDGSGAEAFSASAAAPDRSSPSSPMTAMTEPTRTPFAPSWAYKESQKRAPGCWKQQTYDDFGEDSVILGLYVNGCLVGFLRDAMSWRGTRRDRKGLHTISRRTSPAVKDSPSFFFQDAIPPSVIVGLIAGMLNWESACLRAEKCRPGSG